MLILAIDTATRRTGIALGTAEQILAERSWIGTRRQTTELASAIEVLFATSGQTIDQLSGIVVAIGPGSYTGLRIALGVAKGIALIHRVPLVAIQTHDIVAAGLGHAPHPLLVSIEAGRKRVLVARYAWQAASAETGAEAGWCQSGEIENYSWAELRDSLSAPVVVAGEISAEGRQLLTGFKPDGTNPLILLDDEAGIRQPGVLLRLGRKKLMAGQTEEPQTVTPIYLRNPDGS